MPTREIQRLAWVPALDGLRGIAVLLVMLFHFKLPQPWFPGGFVGVDIYRLIERPALGAKRHFATGASPK